MMIKIIIADDHQLFIDGIKSLLEKDIGITVIGEAANGLELITLLKNSILPDVVLTDIRMPKLNGIEVTKRITKDYPTISVLALSMFDQSDDVIDMLKAGVKGYVTKDVEKKELIAAIHALQKGSFYFSKNLPQDIKLWFEKAKTEKQTLLTKREKEILKLIAEGKTSLQIANRLKLSKFTVDTHRKNIHKKLDIKSNTGLVRYAITNLL